MSAYLNRLASFTEALLFNRNISTLDSRKNEGELEKDKNLDLHQQQEKNVEEEEEEEEEEVGTAGAPCVDFERLRSLCFESGVPDVPGYRQLTWMLLLNYLPSNKARWPQTLRLKRRAYSEFVADLWPFSSDDKNNNNGSAGSVRCPPAEKESSSDALPSGNLALERMLLKSSSGTEINSRKDSSIADIDEDEDQFEKSARKTDNPGFTDADVELLRTIDRDTSRTSASLSFCHMEIPIHLLGGLPSPYFNVESPTSSPEKLETQFGVQSGQPRHQDVVRRILYIYAKLNPGIGYIQGMNHVILPIYYLLASRHMENSASPGDTNLEIDYAAEHAPQFAEHDTFYLFHEILSDYRDFFMHSMDQNTSGGIYSALAALENRIHALNPRLAKGLLDKGVQTAFYAFRWYTCLCAQDLELPDVLRLWDVLFADRPAARRRAMRETELGISSPLHSPALVSPLLDAGSAARAGMFLTDLLATRVITLNEDLQNAAFDEALLALQRHPWADLDKLIRQTHAIYEDSAAAAAAASTSSASSTLTFFSHRFFSRPPTPQAKSVSPVKQHQQIQPRSATLPTTSASTNGVTTGANRIIAAFSSFLRSRSPTPPTSATQAGSSASKVAQTDYTDTPNTISLEMDPSDFASASDIQ